MYITKLQQFLTTPVTNKYSPRTIFWFSLSLSFAAIYGILGLRQAFSSEYVASSDGMIYVFLYRFLDPELFPNDLIADFWQSLTPSGYIIFCKIFASLGIDPFFLGKILPIVLGIIATIYGFLISIEILPVPAVGFFASLMLNQSLWMGVRLSTGVPVAFSYPLFLAFLYYLLRYSFFPCLIAISLQTVFYPQSVLISCGILVIRLISWENLRLSFSSNKKDYWFCVTGLVIVFLLLLPYMLKTSEYGAAITKAQAMMLPELSSEGRTPVFPDGKPTLHYWFCALHSGILPHEWCILRLKPLKPPQIFLGLLLPFLILFSSYFTLGKQVTSKIVFLLQILLVSFSMFISAHLLLFKLFFPGRYTQDPLRILMSIAAGIGLIIIIDAMIKWAKKSNKLTSLDFLLPLILGSFLTFVYSLLSLKIKNLKVFFLLLTLVIFVSILGLILKKYFQKRNKIKIYRQFISLTSVLILSLTIVLYPSLLKFNNFPFPNTDYVTGKFPELYQFFSEKPKDIMIASLANEANNLPVFAKRSILASWKYDSPFRLSFYTQFRQRAIDTINAQYTADLEEVQDFIKKYSVDFWLLDKTAFSPDYFSGNRMNSRWLRQFNSATEQAIANLKQGQSPVLTKLISQCSVFENEQLLVLKSKCILDQAK